MNPAAAWTSPEAYMKRYRGLASRFGDNIKKFADQAPAEVLAAGPQIDTF
jgi:ATP-dependent phosphoenolpyruvate carboxykinase